jgi:hypothetical protein
VIWLNKDKVYFSTHKQKRKVLSGYKSESPISSFNKLKYFVNILSKKRHNTLLKLANKKGTNII